jgi:hypothetical protein
VISASTRAMLEDYLDFRHMARNVYIYRLRWERMRHLVLGCEATLAAVKQDLEGFLAAGEYETEKPPSDPNEEAI